MIFRAFSLAACVVAAGMTASPVEARDTDQRFFQRIEGSWSGPGEIVAGKYKGTKFTCDFKGATPNGSPGMSLDGTCRVGVFSQQMSARVTRGGRSYKGSFLDGAAGKGLDIVAGSVSRDRVVFTLNRKQLNGAMLARLAGDNNMRITISVKVDKKLVPVIGMDLNRVDSVATGTVKR